MAQRIRIVIADDHQRSRGGLRALIASRLELEVVGIAGNGKEAIALADQLRPDIVVMDVEMPEMDGLQATRFIKAHWLHIRVVALSIASSHHEAANEAGADAFVAKGDAPDRLLAVMLGNTPNA